MTIEQLRDLREKLKHESQVKQQMRREISSCFIPDEYFHKGTTLKQIQVREQKKTFLKRIKQELLRVNTQMTIEESDKRCVL